MKTIAIFGAPRSGTSWLGQIFNSSPHVAFRFQPLFSFSFKGRLNEHSNATEIEQFYKELLVTNDEFVLQRKNVSGNEMFQAPKMEITHLVWKEVRYLNIIENLLVNSTTKVVGIIRHPCAVINSWLNAPKEFKSEWSPMEEWRAAPRKNLARPEEFNGYEKWKETAVMFRRYHEKYPEKFCLIKYEDLNNNPEGIMDDVFRFSGLSFGDVTRRFIRKSQSESSTDPYGVFRKDQNVESWKENLIPEIREAILGDEEFRNLDSFYKWQSQ